MNPNIEQLKPYPFERLNALIAEETPPADLNHISLAMGEPKHSPPRFIVDALADVELLSQSLMKYPTTPGTDDLRQSMANWCNKRYALGGRIDSDTQILPLKGTREGLFSFAQAVLSGTSGSRVVIPNPFYQIYEGAALLRGAKPYYLNDFGSNKSFLESVERVPEEVWRNCELMFICSPGNPTGRVLSLEEMSHLIELADRYDFLLASDECYAEIYLDENRPPPGLLQTCVGLQREDFRRCLVFHSLSKRSNLPGLRSGFVAGDQAVMQAYLKYRTYHGSAMPVHTQRASLLAWQDEEHVKNNRALYREKFNQITPG